MFVLNCYIVIKNTFLNHYVNLKPNCMSMSESLSEIKAQSICAFLVGRGAEPWARGAAAGARGAGPWAAGAAAAWAPGAGTAKTPFSLMGTVASSPKGLGLLF